MGGWGGEAWEGYNGEWHPYTVSDWGLPHCHEQHQSLGCSTHSTTYTQDAVFPSFTTALLSLVTRHLMTFLAISYIYTTNICW